MTMETRLNGVTIDNIVNRINQGNYPAVATIAEGFNERTYYTYITNAERLLDNNEIKDNIELILECYRNHKTDKLYDSIVIANNLRESDLKYLWFYSAIKKAESNAEAKHIKIIDTAAEKSWQAAAWLEERRYPERWGQRQNVTINIAQGLKVRTRIQEEIDKGTEPLALPKP